VPIYPCPECKARINRETPVPEGKKLKCGKCGTIFAPVEEVAAARPAAAKKPAPKPAPEVLEPMTEDEREMADAKIAHVFAQVEEGPGIKVDFGEMRKKYPKSKRGPAMALTIEPANFLTAQGIVVCVGAVIFMFVAIFPLVFEPSVTSSETRQRIIMMVGAVVMFAWGSLMCIGAAKLQDLFSYSWALIGAILGLLPFFFGLFALVVLMDPIVKEGFEETTKTPEYRERKRKSTT